MNNADSNEEITPFPFFNRPSGSPAGGPARQAAEGAREHPSGRPRPVRAVNVLLIEDNRGDARLIAEYLAEVEGLSFHLESVDRFGAGLERLARGGIDVVLLDLSLPDSRGLDTFVRLQAAAPGVPVVVLTGFNDEVLAVKAVQEGAEDYLVKGYVNSNLLARSLRYAIERTRRRQAERTLRETQERIRAAREIQQRLFPVSAPRLPGVEMAGASYPADATGGDYYDYIPMADGSVAVVIGDVTGHGFGPALVMASTRAYLRALAQTNTDVANILALANRVLAADVGDDRFVTLLLARLDAEARWLVYSNAGHQSGYVFDSLGLVKRQLGSTAMPLGIMPDGEFPAGERVRLVPGDLVVLLTDGIVEARSPDNALFGAQRVFDLVRLYRNDPAQQIVANLYHAVRAFSQNMPQVDDITAVVVKMTG
jgi:serine phosphatase RsbU (regulator of sigma subunit)